MSEQVPGRGEAGGFHDLLLSHLDSAYNLARWLTRSSHDADDVVQEAYLRAFQYADGFRGGNARAWLLAIVRNTSYKWLRKMRAWEPVTEFDEEIHASDIEPANPEQLLLQHAEGHLVETALGTLPVRFREILVLRELEGLAYKEIADVMGMPMGTVMSTLSRARRQFRHAAVELVNARSPKSATAVEVRACAGART
jgi:RNA polymerase sigma-70 factor (ECF subfamily)